MSPEQPARTDDGAYGVPLCRLRRLVSHWEKFDWRRWEDRLNAYPQFRTSIDGQPVHFLHVRSAVPDALPVVLSHGWAIGNDAGSMISPELGRLMEVLSWFWQHKGAFNVLQGQQPQTLAHALADSPAGLLGWNAQLFDEALDDEFVLANVSLYWLTGTGGTSIRYYYENTHATANGVTGHYSAHTNPDQLAADIRRFFRPLRPTATTNTKES